QTCALPILAGIAAVQRAPSARNRQAYRFVKKRDNSVVAHLTEDTPFGLVDLGIAKLHFELGAHGGAWTWGDGGVFHKAAEEKSCGAVIWRMSEGRREYLLARHNGRSEEHTSELQSRFDLVCRLLLENNNK